MAGISNTSGDSQHLHRVWAGYSNTTGYYGTPSAGIGPATPTPPASDNTFSGFEAGYSNITGYNNTFIGYGAGCSNTIGNSNTFIGFMAGFYETLSNKLYIANSDTSTPLIYGDFSTAQLKIHGLLVAASAAPSDERLKKEIKPLKGSLDTVARLQGGELPVADRGLPGPWLQRRDPIGPDRPGGGKGAP